MSRLPGHAATLGAGPAPSPRKRRSRLRFGLLLFAFALLAGELAVRLAGLGDVSAGARTPQQAAFHARHLFVADDDPAISYVNRPLVDVEAAGIRYRHDARGLRVAPDDGDPAAPAGDGGPGHAGGSRPAVAFLGDSTTYGLGLPWEDTLPALAAGADGALAAGADPPPPAFHPLNLGVCGYTTSQEVALWSRERAALPDVRVVVLVVFPNDFAPGTFLYDDAQGVLYVDPLPLPRSAKAFFWHSALYRSAVSAVAGRMREQGRFDPLLPANREVALDAVGRLAELCRADGRRLLVAALPALERLDPYQFADPVSALAARCAQLGIPYVDLLEPFLAERERQVADYEARSGQPVSVEQRAGFLSQYWIVDPDDHHLGAQANRIAAGALAGAIAPLLRD